MVIKGITFNNIPNKKLGTQITTVITQSNVGNLSNEDYINNPNFYKIFNAIDIDWNGIQFDQDTVINDTADLINIIKSISQEVSTLSSKVTELESAVEAMKEADLQINYESQDGNIQIINPTPPDLEIDYESQDGNIQVVND